MSTIFQVTPVLPRYLKQARWKLPDKRDLFESKIVQRMSTEMVSHRLLVDRLELGLVFKFRQFDGWLEVKYRWLVGLD